MLTGVNYMTQIRARSSFHWKLYYARVLALIIIRVCVCTGMTEAFNVELHVSPLKSHEDKFNVLKSQNIFRSVDLDFAVEALGSNYISIKRLLMIVEMARQSGDDEYVDLHDWRSVLADLTAVV